MYKLFKIAKNNIKRQKGDMITFLILTFLSAFLIFNCASALSGLGRLLDESFKQVNGPEILFWNHDNEKAEYAAEKAFSEYPDFVKYEKTPVADLNADYRNTKDDEFTTFEFYIHDIKEQSELLNVGIPDVEYAEDDILLPFNQKGVFAIGDTMELKVEDNVYRFRVAGFVEDPYFCSTLNISTHSVYISKTMIDTMAERESVLYQGYFYKGKVDMEAIEKRGIDLDEVEKEIDTAYKEASTEWKEAHPDDKTPYNTSYMLLNWEMMRSGDGILPTIVMAVVLIFAILVLVIALIIIAFSISNFIRRNMKNTGILEASGYTVAQLKGALLLQMASVTILGVVLGLAVAMLMFNTFGTILSSVVGLSWNQPLNIRVAVRTFVALVAVVLIATWLIGRKYNRITVLDALRGGINTHNYRKNYFPFEKTPLPVSLVLSLKDMVGGRIRNGLMVLIILLLSMFSVVGFGMVQNFGEDPDNMIRMFGFELGTIGVTGDNTIIDDIRALPEVDRAYARVSIDFNLEFNGKTKKYSTYAIDDRSQTINTNVIEGRMPTEDNEILVTIAIADDMGIHPGDVVTLENAGKKAEFLVTGLNQRMEQYGRTIMTSLAGAEKLTDAQLHYIYFVTGKEGCDYEVLKERMDQIGKEKGVKLECVDTSKAINATVQTLSDTMKSICAVILVMAVVVVIFVESLVIRAKISREWRSMGISKALGETSRGLLLQIMLTNLPAILVGAILGAVIAPFIGAFGTTVVFSSFGICKVCFKISTIYMLITIAGITIFAVLTSALAGMRVRKLKPVEMITED